MQNHKKKIPNIKLFDSNITPTPSPRIKKKLRREQFLEEHKKIGKLVLSMAKTPLSNLAIKSEGEKASKSANESVPTEKSISNENADSQVNMFSLLLLVLTEHFLAGAIITK